MFCKPFTVDLHFINAMLDFFFSQMVELQSLWAKQTAVVVFLRRFGWPLCRLWSTELSSVKPQLDAHGVRLCGIGLEEFGVEEFQEGKFFTGGLKACYETLIINNNIIIISIITIKLHQSYARVWDYRSSLESFSSGIHIMNSTSEVWWALLSVIQQYL